LESISDWGASRAGTRPLGHLSFGPVLNATPAKLAEHYRKLAAEEVAAKLTNEARARHYAKAVNYWKLADTAQNTPSDSE
jgi:hypothetical protein